MNYEEILKISQNTLERFVHIQTKILAPSHRESARFSIDNIEQFLQRQWVLPLPLFLSLGFIPTVGFIEPHSASERFTAPQTAFPLILFLFKKRENKKEKKRNRRKPLKIQGKKGKADTDPAATLRMHLDPRLGENEEKMKKER